MSRTAQARARSIEQLKEHYEIEAELADRLRHSTRESRALLYSAVYDELFRRVPAHPALTRVTQPEVLAEVVEEKLRLLSRFLRRDSVFLEVGAGDCRLSLAVADKVRQVYALDVSAEVVRGVRFKRNASFILSKGTDIPLPENSVDVAYSYQVMEHIHPDDALEQLGNIHRVLAPGGLYVCG
jgi:SAM-dependent methyltransferase